MQESETSGAKVLYLFILFLMYILLWFSSNMETARLMFDVKTSGQAFLFQNVWIHQEGYVWYRSFQDFPLSLVKWRVITDTDNLFFVLQHKSSSKNGKKNLCCSVVLWMVRCCYTSPKASLLRKSLEWAHSHLIPPPHTHPTDSSANERQEESSLQSSSGVYCSHTPKGSKDKRQGLMECPGLSMGSGANGLRIQGRCKGRAKGNNL